MELFFETTGTATTGIAPSHGEDGDGSIARIRESAQDERSIRRSPFLLAGSRDGLAQLPRLLAMATDTALTVRRLAGPLPAGKTADVLGAVAAASAPSIPFPR